ncbi:maleylpyruvate isomerase family mycothiol-dependent enzyme [Streptomyces sp. H39-S7]|uniref:maleylpyruvate isomerase family mycothiol-dependent enzyme n=1 Tax=Streptomyces sp. H39-S7 TaxID=3004357 RepID=UPI0022AFA448|nr:maleylpyruvate isomerase family mycothiol-dependent enzyme [Streptomyces sp. H39-S7]MCZ4122977.1 maleylpyruvate isomerase family mycothiol-dependent enzyme [Streptomyces sp. H39-S7]
MAENRQLPRTSRGFPDPVPAILAGQARLRGLLVDLTDADVRAPSALPGWTRGHLLSHIEGVGFALARQARYALEDELIDPYDGGRPARDAAIEAGHGRSAAELRAAVTAALDEAEQAWTAVGPRDLERPVRYRDATLAAAAHAWWRELEIHTADAAIGYRTARWSRPFCAQVLDFLAPRVPDGVRLTLAASDGPEPAVVLGDGRPVTVRGALTDLTAWLAGREPEGPLDGGAEPLPELRPWP